MVEMELMKSVLRLLKYSWEPIDYDYGQLTIEERNCISKDHFDVLVNLIKAMV